MPLTCVGQVEFDRLRDARPEIVLTVEINGHPIKALLDSATGGSILDKGGAARVGVTPEAPGVVAAGAGSGLGNR